MICYGETMQEQNQLITDAFILKCFGGKSVQIRLFEAASMSLLSHRYTDPEVLLKFCSVGVICMERNKFKPQLCVCYS